MLSRGDFLFFFLLLRMFADYIRVEGGGGGLSELMIAIAHIAGRGHFIAHQSARLSPLMSNWIQVLRRHESI